MGKGGLVAAPEGKPTALEGEPVMRRLWDFNRMPGSRAIVSAALHERYGQAVDGLLLGAAPGPTATVAPPLATQLIELPSVFARCSMPERK